jgi:hypothetical protein
MGLGSVRASGPYYLSCQLLKAYLDMLFDLMLQSDTIGNRAVVNVWKKAAIGDGRYCAKPFSRK